MFSVEYSKTPYHNDNFVFTVHKCTMCVTFLTYAWLFTWRVGGVWGGTLTCPARWGGYLTGPCHVSVQYGSDTPQNRYRPNRALSGTRTVRQKRGVDASFHVTEFSNQLRTNEKGTSLAYFFSVFYRNQTLYRPCKMQQSKTACFKGLVLGLFLGLLGRQ